jgi:hypothetical protein
VLSWTVALILLALVALYVETFNIAPPFLSGYPGDAFYPRLVLYFSLLCAVLILVRSAFMSLDAAQLGYDTPDVSVHWLELLSVVVLVLLFAQTVETIGFEITTLTLMLVLLVPRLRATLPTGKAVLYALALTIPTVLLLYVGFVLLLNIPFPLKVLPSYIF